MLIKKVRKQEKEGERKRGKKVRCGWGQELRGRKGGEGRREGKKKPGRYYLQKAHLFPSLLTISKCQLDLRMPCAGYCRVYMLIPFGQTHPKGMIDLPLREFICGMKIKSSSNLPYDILILGLQISAGDEGLLPGKLRDCLETQERRNSIKLVNNL